MLFTFPRKYRSVRTCVAYLVWVITWNHRANRWQHQCFCWKWPSPPGTNDDDDNKHAALGVDKARAMHAKTNKNRTLRTRSQSTKKAHDSETRKANRVCYILMYLLLHKNRELVNAPVRQPDSHTAAAMTSLSLCLSGGDDGDVISNTKFQVQTTRSANPNGGHRPWWRWRCDDDDAKQLKWTTNAGQAIPLSATYPTVALCCVVNNIQPNAAYPAQWVFRPARASRQQNHLCCLQLCDDFERAVWIDIPYTNDDAIIGCQTFDLVAFTSTGRVEVDNRAVEEIRQDKRTNRVRGQRPNEKWGDVSAVFFIAKSVPAFWSVVLRSYIEIEFDIKRARKRLKRFTWIPIKKGFKL